MMQEAGSDNSFEIIDNKSISPKPEPGKDKSNLLLHVKFKEFLNLIFVSDSYSCYGCVNHTDV